jgi:hypothetical protein
VSSVRPSFVCAASIEFTQRQRAFVRQHDGQGECRGFADTGWHCALAFLVDGGGTLVILCLVRG